LVGIRGYGFNATVVDFSTQGLDADRQSFG
jgi:hypothetical protein